MKRVMRVVVAVVLSSFFLGVFAYDADAQRRRRRRGQRTEQVAPRSDEIAPALGDLRWGMTRDEVYNQFVGKIRQRYNPRITKARDAMVEDRLRHQMNEEIQTIRRSYVRFRGQTTGWDVSFLRDEFTHGNDESMLVLRDDNSQNFYFFIRNRLWKWYKAFDADVFTGQTFEQFAGALQGRFGRALDRSGRMTDRGEEKRWLEWQDDSTRLRAIDENRFYGFYCLVFEDKSTLGQLETLRTNTVARREQGHALVDAVVADGEEASTANQDIVDRITGRIRRRTDAPEDAAMTEAAAMGGTTTMGTATMGTSSSSSTPSSSSMGTEDDPLRGLDL